MESPTGIIPEELMYPEKLKEVVAFLKAQPYPGNLKRSLIMGWARVAGIQLKRKVINDVEYSGIDYP